MGVVLTLYTIFNKFIIIPVLGVASGLGWVERLFYSSCHRYCSNVCAIFIFFEGAGLNKKIGIMISRTFPSE